MFDVQSDALVTLGRSIRRAQQHLPAHPEMRDQGGIVGLEREPEELATPRGRDDTAPFEATHEIRGAGRMPGEGTLIEHADTRDDRAGHGGSEPRSDDLDLGKLRHVR
jgi:hypothetical protein